MTKQKTTKKTLLTSVLSLILCMAMLIGTTFAWFTDSVTSGKNRIQAGNLDVAMSYKNTSMADYDDVETPTSPDFFKDINGDPILWEPGAVAYANFKVENKGTLALKYSLETIIAGCNYTIDGKSLADVLTVKVIKNEVTYATREDAVTAAKGSTDTLESFAYVNTNMEKDTTDYFTVVLYWEPSPNDNEFNVDPALWIDIELSLVATQAVNEEDSFNNEYDKDAVYGDVMATTDAELKAAIEDADVTYIAIKGNLTYDWGNASYENSNALLMKGKTFIGADNDASITFAGYGSANPIVDVNLRNITVEDATVGDNENSWEHGHLEFQDLNAVNVVFADSIMLDGNSVLTNCSMNNTISSWYGIWIEGGNIVLKDCSFRGTRSVKIHEAYSSDVKSVVIDNCVFGSLSEKPGIAIGDVDATTIITIKNNVFVNCQEGDNKNYMYESDTDVASYKFTCNNNEVKNGVTTVAEATEFTGATEGGELYMTDDVTYSNTDPNKQMILEAENAIEFEGNGNTITVTGSDPSVGNHGYVAFVPPAGKDVTVSNLTVTGTGFVEMGHYGIGGGSYVANNLVLKDVVSTLANGDKGYTLACTFSHYGTATLNNCTMTGAQALIDGAIPVDAGFPNKTTTTVNGGKYGTIYCWSHSVVAINDAEVNYIYTAPIKGQLTIGSGTHVGTININSTSSNVKLDKIIVEDGATVDTVIYAGVTYTWAEWIAR